MHKGIIILISAQNKPEALEKIKDFLDGYKNDVWDWYQIGGRWTQTLSPYYEQFREFLNKTFPGDIYQSTIDKAQSQLQKYWESLGATGQNPCCDHYGLPDDGNTYDVVKLETCLQTVQKWEISLDTVIQQHKEAEEWKQKENWLMYGYVLESIGKLYQQKFCTDCNVFNINANNYSVPKKEDVDGWYAVMVDIHF